MKINHTVDAATGCWLWGGKIDPGGYGQMYAGKNSQGNSVYVLAHRAYYEHFVGPIPDGYHLDHVWKRGCKHKHCVNPAHLEPVTPSENSKRKVYDRCKNGHGSENFSFVKDGKGGVRRRCLKCCAKYARTYRQKEAASG